MDTIRIGIIGAGGNTKGKHIPLLQKIEGVQIVAVCNRSLESSRKVCEQFNIPEPVADAHELIGRSDIDAIVIGTWPYKHAEYSIAALEHGKHVLTEARMAMNAAEAQRMLEASRKRPELVAQVVPAPFTLPADPIVCDLVANRIGTLVAVQAHDNAGTFPDMAAAFGWRHDRVLSGNNIMAVGIRYESILRWVGPVAGLCAEMDVVVNDRVDSTGNLRPTEIPDQLHVVGRLWRDNATFAFTASAVAGFNKQSGCWIHGTKGTIYAGFNGEVKFGQAGEAEMRPVDVKAAGHPGWRVEEEFINAIRGREKVRYTTFEDGVKYMRFMDALYDSARTKQRLELT